MMTMSNIIYEYLITEYIVGEKYYTTITDFIEFEKPSYTINTTN